MSEGDGGPLPPPPGFPPPSGRDPSNPTPIISEPTSWWKRRFAKLPMWAWLSIGVVVVLVLIGALAGGDDNSDEVETAAATTQGVESTAATTSSPSENSAAPSTSVAPTTAAPTTAVADSTAPPTAPATTAPPSSPSTQPTPTTTSPPPAQASEPVCAYLGADDFGDMQLELQFANPLGEVEALSVTYVVNDATGTRFYTGEAYFEYLSTDERLRVQQDTLEAAPSGVDAASITCSILGIEESFGSGPLEPAGDGSACTFVEVDDFGDIQIELAVTSPFDTTENIGIYYALRSPDGTRFDDNTAVVDLVAPGETIRSSQDTLISPPDWVGDDEISCGILGLTAFDF